MWKKIIGFPVYQISDNGEIKNQQKHLNPSVTKAGYSRVCLSREGARSNKYVHILVADAFLGVRPDGKEINHKNGIKTDNRLENLEYITHKENIAHARVLRPWQGTGGGGGRSRVVTNEQDKHIHNMRAAGFSWKKISQDTGININTAFSAHKRYLKEVISC